MGPLRITHLLFGALVFLPSMAFASTGFRDILDGSTYADAVMYLKSQGIAQGYADGNFRPQAHINRAEFTKILMLQKFGQQMIDMCNTALYFRDVQNEWFRPYICRAKDANVIDGYPDGMFRPEKEINFAEAAKIIAKVDTYNYGDPVLPPRQTGPWYRQFVEYLGLHGAIPLTISTADQPLTRGEMAEIVYRLHDHVYDKPSRTYADFTVVEADWQTYTDASGAYVVEYPAGWKAKNYGDSTGFRRVEDSYDRWTIQAFVKKDMYTEHQIIDNIGAQFGKERRFSYFNYSSNGVSGVRYVITNASDPTWFFVGATFDKEGKIYLLSNGAVQDDRFGQFTESFRWLRQ